MALKQKWLSLRVRIIAGMLAILVAYILTQTVRSEKIYQTSLSPRQVVEAFQKMAFVEYKPKEAVLKYVSVDMVDHNPKILGNRASIIAHLDRLDWTKGKPKSDIKRIISQGEYVVVHHHLRRNMTDKGIAVVEIFRVKQGYITEHWDVLQPVPTDNVNKRDMF